MLDLAPLPNSLADGQLPLVALALLLPVLAGALLWHGRHARREWLIFLGLAALALVVRALAAWGPADLAEPRRWDVLYALQPDDRPLFYGVPTLVELLVRLGVPPLALYRGLGPVSGALAVLATAWLARATQLRLRWAVLAGVLVALWPAHIHHSASGGFGVLAGAALAATLAAACDDRLLGAWRPLSVAVLATLAIYVRPEARVVLPALALLAARPTWSWRQRTQLGLFLLVLLAGYAPMLASSADRVVESSPADLAYWLLGEPRVAPIWWCWAGLAGIAVGRGDRLTRGALGLTLAALLAGYLLTTEPNPGFGLWRYYMTLLPILAVGAALLLARWPVLERRAALVVALAAATLLPYAGLWLQPSDLHLEFSTAMQGAKSALDRTDLLLLPDQAGDTHTGVDHFATVLLALNLATGQRFDAQATPRQRGTMAAVPVASLEKWLDDPQRTRPHRIVAWLGVAVSPARQTQLLSLGKWRTLHENTGDVLLQLPESDARCPTAVGLGVTLHPCHLTVGWKVLEP